MSGSREQIFNLAAQALLLQRQFINADTDTSNEAKVFRSLYDTALHTTLQDLNLDSTMDQVTLELLEEEPNDLWLYAYAYPADCVFFRRLQSLQRRDNRYSHIPKQVRMHEGRKCIFTNEEDAIAEYINEDIELSYLSPTVILAISLRLASLSASLIVGKGSKDLAESIDKKYLVVKMEAQEQDRLENENFEDEVTESEFVAERTS